MTSVGSLMRCSHFSRAGLNQRGCQPNLVAVKRFLQRRGRAAPRRSVQRRARPRHSFGCDSRLRIASSGDQMKLSPDGTPLTRMPAGAMSVRLSMRARVADQPLSAAIQPPSEWPMTWTRSTRRLRRANRDRYIAMSGTSRRSRADRPRRRSRDARAPASRSARQARRRTAAIAGQPPAPCRNRTGLPLPARRTRTRVPRVTRDSISVAMIADNLSRAPCLRSPRICGPRSPARTARTADLRPRRRCRTSWR